MPPPIRSAAAPAAGGLHRYFVPTPNRRGQRMTTTDLDRTHRHRRRQADLRLRSRDRAGRCPAARRRARASGVSNYSRNIDALAAHFRVIVPDMPGYGSRPRASINTTRSAISRT